MTSVHLLNDGQTFLVSTLDSTVRLMDRERGELLQTFKGHRNDDYKSRACVGHGEATVLAGDEDGFVHIWDLESVRLPYPRSGGNPEAKFSEGQEDGRGQGS